MTSSQLEERLNYCFHNSALLEEARCHSSYINEHIRENLKNNERLEFLGDAVVNLVVGHMLIEQYPDLPEGDLSRMRAGLVNESTLAEVSRKLELGDFLLLVKGEIQSNGREKSSILADAFEAITAAIYLDGGFYPASRFVRSHFQNLVLLPELPPLSQDNKSRLQEIVQTVSQETPVYQTIGESGPDHDKTFFVQVRVLNVTAEGNGKSKKAAEQEAARCALDRIMDQIEKQNRVLKQD